MPNCSGVSVDRLFLPRPIPPWAFDPLATCICRNAPIQEKLFDLITRDGSTIAVPHLATLSLCYANAPLRCHSVAPLPRIKALACQCITVSLRSGFALAPQHRVAVPLSHITMPAVWHSVSVLPCYIITVVHLSPCHIISNAVVAVRHGSTLSI